MLILLSDGAGLTARQCATVLARTGYQVEALCPAGLCLARMTRHVRQVHPVPAIGRDPFGWLDAALGIAARRRAGLLLPVQEQVAVMSLARHRIEAAGLATAVPDFGALAQVQDKVSAFSTLTRLGLPQPPAVLAATAAELAGAELGRPVFVKTPIGTASAGVRRVTSREALRQLAADYERQGIFEGAARDGGVLDSGVLDGGGVLVQQAVAGPLVMVQSVFCRGELVASHACQRAREGASGGASHKVGLDLPEAREHLARLGAALGWHGALSADVILGPAGIQFIDINPRLVEPVNALYSGVDLVRALVDVARSGTSRPQPPASPVQPGARTHQLLLAILGAAQHGGRRGVARELRDGLLHRGDYRDSHEELTPGGGDLMAGLPVALSALATLVRPAAWRYLTSGGVGAYSLSPAAWEELRRAAAAATALAIPPGRRGRRARRRSRA
jgi:hypothetical protein